MQIQRILQTIDNQSLVIQVPESFINKQVEILVITLDESELSKPIQRRVPPPKLAGKVREKGDVLSSVPIEDWGIH
ncbi:MAG: hypothetical protein FJ190_08300 [Gammaproteobacteria bacterium]|nr:hypothetical protein [Gammaproteobacteria bacterium]